MAFICYCSLIASGVFTSFIAVAHEWISQEIVAVITIQFSDQWLSSGFESINHQIVGSIFTRSKRGL